MSARLQGLGELTPGPKKRAVPEILTSGTGLDQFAAKTDRAAGKWTLSLKRLIINRIFVHMLRSSTVLGS
jgi:hypothetical protein